MKSPIRWRMVHLPVLVAAVTVIAAGLAPQPLRPSRVMWLAAVTAEDPGPPCDNSGGANPPPHCTSCDPDSDADCPQAERDRDNDGYPDTYDHYPADPNRH